LEIKEKYTKEESEAAKKEALRIVEEYEKSKNRMDKAA